LDGWLNIFEGHSNSMDLMDCRLLSNMAIHSQLPH